MHLQEPEFFFGSRMTRFLRDTSHHVKTPTYFYKEVYKRKWYRKELLIVLFEESREEYLQVSLQADSNLTRRHEQNTSGTRMIKMTASKGHWLSNQPRLTHVTPTALLSSWVIQPI